MNRRAFLGMLGAAVAGATLDPERLLWRPAAKLISIPTPRLTLDDIDLEKIRRRYLGPAIKALAHEIDLQVMHDYVFLGGERWDHRIIANPRRNGP